MALLKKKKTLCLFEVELQTTQLPECRAQIDVEYRVLQIEAWAKQPHTSHLTDRHLFQMRLERGEKFWTAQQNGHIVSYCWATQEAVEIGEIHSLIRPRRDEIYLYDAFTFTEYRGRNLYPTLLQRILVHSREATLRRALIFVMSDNIASIRGVEKAGFKEFQRVTYGTMFGFGRYSHRPRLQDAAGVDLVAT